MTKLILKSKEDVEQIQSLCGKLDFRKAWEVEVKPFSFSRSAEQNKRYWKLIKELGDYLGYAESEMHELMKYKFLSYKQEMLGEEIPVIPSTSTLTIKEFVEYLSKVEIFASEHGFTFKEDY